MAAGTTVANRYRLIELRGEGALSVVYRAHDTALGRDVALKVLKTGPGLDSHAAERFDAEARTAARIVHPRVAAIYDVIDCELGRAIVMEYVDGPSLAERLKVCRSLPEPAVIAYARQIAEALAAAHAQGVVHRDIKPGNVLLTSGDEVKVVDFGLVKALDGSSATLTQTGTFVGSVHYVSPEQAQGRAISASSDLYSLGIVIYQMATGNVPYSGDSPLAIALAHVTNKAPTRRELQAVMSPGLAAIVAQLLQKDPSRRFQHASDVLDALDGLEGKQLPAPPTAALDAPTVTAPIQIVPPRRRIPQTDGRATAIVAGTVLLVLLFLVLVKPAFAVLADLRGHSASVARTMLSQSGLHSSVSARPSQSARAGIVIAQSPAPGTHLARGAMVALIESSGVPYVRVPSIRGLSVTAAQRLLHRLKLQARLGAAYSNAAPYTIVDQAPTAGTQVRPGTAMMVVFAVPPVAQYPVYNPGPPGPRGHGKHHKERGD